jgi:hypothetical protein
MKRALIILALMAGGAQAAGYPPLTMSDSGDTCYTWEGGRGSAGSFTKCSPQVSVAAAPKLPPPVVASPVMMPQSAPITCAPPPKPILHKKRPAPKKC